MYDVVFVDYMYVCKVYYYMWYMYKMYVTINRTVVIMCVRLIVHTYMCCDGQVYLYRTTKVSNLRAFQFHQHKTTIQPPTNAKLCNVSHNPFIAFTLPPPLHLPMPNSFLSQQLDRHTCTVSGTFFSVPCFCMKAAWPF